MARGISREGIVGAALEVLDDRGIDGVTVRAVAGRLGVRAPALYYHVRDKQELLDEMGTEIQRRVVAELAGRPPGEHWTDDLVAYARALRTVHLAHRDGARTFSGTLVTDPAVLRAQEPWLRRWRAAGVSAIDALDGFDLVTAFVVGFVIEEQERLRSATDDPTRYADEDRDRRLGDGVPLVAELGRARHDTTARFDRQLDALVAGIDARFGR
ncbi:TetR/AcrR family transcriptional regulator C-terminal domain-containing protein [Actinomycetospora termitidis]|uniref:TetR/AcrR family transcriptional regulator C-terminal domain-containing protein n=1 Tax=Actinomycetospora termitidis TaxID=3053470 RepID=A0ABT7MCF0_9PSEU|nr:TetR/AcrR family transcriptional regulator C-terminal domain-containing protein [Actinomycetospora sp. Odt1-22]MDL5158341.1 TetR/AcrR family transcriptional regulator C-terminal domain-containing protein [Actinomycetospora sp. Odt1-22]